MEKTFFSWFLKDILFKGIILSNLKNTNLPCPDYMMSDLKTV